MHARTGNKRYCAARLRHSYCIPAAIITIVLITSERYISGILTGSASVCAVTLDNRWSLSLKARSFFFLNVTLLWCGTPFVFDFFFVKLKKEKKSVDRTRCDVKVSGSVHLLLNYAVLARSSVTLSVTFRCKIVLHWEMRNWRGKSFSFCNFLFGFELVCFFCFLIRFAWLKAWPVWAVLLAVIL